MEKKRSVGVTVAAVISIIFSIIVGIYSFIGYSTFLPLLIVGILFAMIFLVSGIGLLKLKSWARILFVLGMIIWLFLGLLQFYITRGIQPQPSLGSILTYFFIIHFLPFVISIYFFTRPKVKEQFK